MKSNGKSRLDRLAERVEPKAVWQDLVLPVRPLSLLRAMAAHVRRHSTVCEDGGPRRRMSPGFGVVVLFAGACGTGKTLAAEVMARELQLDLYRIDLAAVVSKYTGETEKNLRCVFDAAADGGAILFFDEADTLFGRRTGVKDGWDRYANSEMDSLLQRMESYWGLVILATNNRNVLDPALLRRFRFIIPFPGP